MKTVQQEYCVYVGDEEEETTLPITMCETIEDVLSLDATVDKERLRRADGWRHHDHHEQSQ